MEHRRPLHPACAKSLNIEHRAHDLAWAKWAHGRALADGRMTDTDMLNLVILKLNES